MSSSSDNQVDLSSSPEDRKVPGSLGNEPIPLLKPLQEEDSKFKGVASPFLQAGVGAQSRSDSDNHAIFSNPSQVKSENIDYEKESSTQPFSKSELSDPALEAAVLTSVDPLADTAPLYNPHEIQVTETSKAEPQTTSAINVDSTGKAASSSSPKIPVKSELRDQHHAEDSTATAASTSAPSKKRSSKEPESHNKKTGKDGKDLDEEDPKFAAQGLGESFSISPTFHLSSNLNSSLSSGMAIVGISTSDPLIQGPNAKAKELYQGIKGIFGEKKGEKEKEKGAGRKEASEGAEVPISKETNISREASDAKKTEKGFLSSVRRSLSVSQGATSSHPDVLTEEKGKKPSVETSQTQEKPLPVIDTSTQGGPSAESGALSEKSEPKKDEGFASGRRFGFITRKSHLPSSSFEDNQELEQAKSYNKEPFQSPAEDSSEAVVASGSSPQVSSPTSNLPGEMTSPPTSPIGPSRSEREKRFSFQGIRRRFSSHAQSSGEDYQQPSHQGQVQAPISSEVATGVNNESAKDRERERRNTTDRERTDREAILVPALTYGRNSGQAMKDSSNQGVDSPPSQEQGQHPVPSQPEGLRAPQALRSSSEVPSSRHEASKTPRPAAQSKRSSFSEFRNKVKDGVEKFKNGSSTDVNIGSAKLNTEEEEKKKKVKNVRDIGNEMNQRAVGSGQVRSENDPQSTSTPRSHPTTSVASKPQVKAFEPTTASSGLLSTWTNSVKSFLGGGSHPKEAKSATQSQPLGAEEAIVTSSSGVAAAVAEPESTKVLSDKEKRKEMEDELEKEKEKQRGKEARKSWKDFVAPSQWAKTFGDEDGKKGGTEVQIGGKKEHGGQKAQIRQKNLKEGETSTTSPKSNASPQNQFLNGEDLSPRTRAPVEVLNSNGKEVLPSGGTAVSPQSQVKAHWWEREKETAGGDAASEGRELERDDLEKLTQKEGLEIKETKPLDQDDYFGSAVNKILPPRADEDGTARH